MLDKPHYQQRSTFGCTLAELGSQPLRSLHWRQYCNGLGHTNDEELEHTGGTDLQQNNNLFVDEATAPPSTQRLKNHVPKTNQFSN